jgi:hypothetical protein
MLRREMRERLSGRWVLGPQPNVPGKTLEPVRGEVGIRVEPQQLRVVLARPGDPALGRLGSEVRLEDA